MRAARFHFFRNPDLGPVLETALALGVALVLFAASAGARALPAPDVPTPPAATTAPLAAGSAARGQALFTGATRFANGGPACAECHAIAGLPFPGGGTLAPDLSGAYARMGAQGMDMALRTLYFPAMVPIYHARQLTPAERADLVAFFAAARPPASPPRTGEIVVIAVLGCLALFLLTGYVWRDRSRGVRAPMVRRALAARRGRAPSFPPNPAANKDGSGSSSAGRLDSDHRARSATP